MKLPRTPPLLLFFFSWQKLRGKFLHKWNWPEEKRCSSALDTQCLKTEILTRARAEKQTFSRQITKTTNQILKSTDAHSEHFSKIKKKCDFLPFFLNIELLLYPYSSTHVCRQHRHTPRALLLPRLRAFEKLPPKLLVMRWWWWKHTYNNAHNINNHYPQKKQRTVCHWERRRDLITCIIILVIICIPQ